jgi:hypothetical protein
MRQLKLLFLFLLVCGSIHSQDSTKTRLFNHEIGFNSVSLLRQLVFFNPGTAEQLPFDLFYNLYFKDKYGLRFGAGILSNYTETEIEGQNSPRTTISDHKNFRAGFSMNFAKYGRVTLNAFADFVIRNEEVSTAVTSTMQTFPNPITTQTVKSSLLTSGAGGQAGVGVKFNIYRQLSLYAEVPISIMVVTTTQEDLIQETGVPDESSKTISRTSGTKIALPTTIYLVLRF